jgi:ABC-type nitrate/sulfonate/bicarbonate transport system substrate-binding protein
MGFPKYSVIHMLVAYVASQVGIPAKKVTFVDIPYDDALLAAQSGSLDVVGVGLTQRAEALKQGGRVILNMDDVGLLTSAVSWYARAP